VCRQFAPGGSTSSDDHRTYRPAANGADLDDLDDLEDLEDLEDPTVVDNLDGGR
jgi:hypothetical protein